MKSNEINSPTKTSILRKTLALALYTTSASIFGAVAYNWYQKPWKGERKSVADIFQQNVLYPENILKPHLLNRPDIIIGELLDNPYTVIPELSNLLKSFVSGPWDIKTNHKEMIQEITNDINLIPLTRVVALDDLGSVSYQGKIMFTRPSRGTSGHTDYYGNIVIDIYDGDYEQRGTLAHEISHRSMMILNSYKSADPYALNDKKAKDEFEYAMIQSLKNLHQNLVPPPIPEDPKQIASDISGSVRFGSPTKRTELIRIFTTMFSRDLFSRDLYTERDYHAEFVVRLPEIIARFGDLPPSLIDAFEPLMEYYKTKITPKMMDYIENHPYKGNLIPTDVDKYHPETYLSRSGENELLARAAANTLKGDEAALVTQMEEIKILVRNGHTQDAISFLHTITDERVIRFTLSQAIENNNPKLFKASFEKIKAPQYLGPQLVRATEKHLLEMALTLMPAVQNKYYLAKATKHSVRYLQNEEITSNQVIEDLSKIFTLASDKVQHDGWFRLETPDPEFISSYTSFIKERISKIRSFEPQDIRLSDDLKMTEQDPSIELWIGNLSQHSLPDAINSKAVDDYLDLPKTSSEKECLNSGGTSEVFVGKKNNAVDPKSIRNALENTNEKGLNVAPLKQKWNVKSI